MRRRKAISTPKSKPPEIRWRPFQLNPDMPLEGIPRQEYIRRKFGPNGGANYKRVAAVGARLLFPNRKLNDFVGKWLRDEAWSLIAPRVAAYAAASL